MTHRGSRYPLIIAAEEAVQRFNFRYDFDRQNANAINFELVTQEVGSFQAQLVVSSKEQLVRLFVMIAEAPDDAAAVPVQIELACRVNQVLAVGTVVADYDDGTTWFRHTVDMEPVQHYTDAIVAMMNQSVFALRFYRAAERFIKGGAIPRMAVEAGLIVLDAA